MVVRHRGTFSITLNPYVVRWRDSPVSIMARLRAGWPRSRCSVTGRILSSLERPGSSSETLPGLGPFSRGYNNWDVNLATHLHIVSRSEMPGYVPILPLEWRLIKHEDNFTFLPQLGSRVLCLSPRVWGDHLLLPFLCSPSICLVTSEEGAFLFPGNKTH